VSATVVVVEEKPQ